MTPPSRPPTDALGHSGFTLSELLVVLAICGLALMTSMPNLHRQRVRYTTISASRELHGLVLKARFEAIRRHRPAGLYVDSNGRTIVSFVDSNGNGSYDADVDEMFESHSVSSWLSLDRPDAGNAVDLVSGGGTCIVFRTDGGVQGGDPTRRPAVYMADPKGNFVRVRINSITGGPRFEKRVTGNTWSPRTKDWSWEY